MSFRDYKYQSARAVLILLYPPRFGKTHTMPDIIPTMICAETFPTHRCIRCFAALSHLISNLIHHDVCMGPLYLPQLLWRRRTNEGTNDGQKNRCACAPHSRRCMMRWCDAVPSVGAPLSSYWYYKNDKRLAYLTRTTLYIYSHNRKTLPATFAQLPCCTTVVIHTHRAPFPIPVSPHDGKHDAHRR